MRVFISVLFRDLLPTRSEVGNIVAGYWLVVNHCLGGHAAAGVCFAGALLCQSWVWEKVANFFAWRG
jgi:hypothetical protein